MEGGLADMNSPVFNPKAIKATSSPDDLEKTVKVTTPTVWLILIACTALLIGLLAWGIWGTVNNTVSCTGLWKDGAVVCLLTKKEVKQIHKGDAADVSGIKGTVEKIASLPLSKDEAADYTGSAYMVEEMMTGKWGFLVQLKMQFGKKERKILNGTTDPVQITTAQISPISAILNGA